jgi:hypothetical protein
VDAYHLFTSIFPDKIGVMMGVMMLSSQTAVPKESNGLSLVAMMDPAEWARRVIIILQSIGNFFVLVIPLLLVVRIEWAMFQAVPVKQRNSRARFTKIEVDMKAADPNFSSKSYEYYSDEEDPDVEYLNLHARGNPATYTRKFFVCCVCRCFRSCCKTRDDNEDDDDDDHKGKKD